MITTIFRYEMPETIQAAAAILAEASGPTAVISGGTWVVPEMSRHLRKPTTVVDLRRAGVGTIQRMGDEIVIGAATSYATALASDDTPSLLRSLAAGVTGGSQVRNQGSFGGSACYAYPSSDAPGALVAIGAIMLVRSISGTRRVPVGEFFVDAFTTCLQAGEILEGIAVDVEVAARACAHVKFKAAEGSYPIVTASCVADADGQVRRVSIGGASATPILAHFPPHADATDISTAVRSLLAQPWEDVLATGNYRRHLAGVMAVRAVEAVRNQTPGATP